MLIQPDVAVETWVTSKPEALLDLTGWSATMTLAARPVPDG